MPRRPLLLPPDVRWEESKDTAVQQIWSAFAWIEQMKLAVINDPDAARIRDISVSLGNDVQNELIGHGNDIDKLCRFVKDVLSCLRIAKNSSVTRSIELQMISRLLTAIEPIKQSVKTRQQALNTLHIAFIELADNKVPEAHHLVSLRRDLADRKFQSAENCATFFRWTSVVGSVVSFACPAVAPLVFVTVAVSMGAKQEAKTHLTKKESAGTALTQLREMRETIKLLKDNTYQLADHLKVLGDDLMRAQEESSQGALASMGALQYDFAMDAWQEVYDTQRAVAAVIPACVNHFLAHTSHQQ